MDSENEMAAIPTEDVPPRTNRACPDFPSIASTSDPQASNFLNWEQAVDLILMNVV